MHCIDCILVLITWMQLTNVTVIDLFKLDLIIENIDYHIVTIIEWTTNTFTGHKLVSIIIIHQGVRSVQWSVIRLISYCCWAQRVEFSERAGF